MKLSAPLGHSIKLPRSVEKVHSCSKLWSSSLIPLFFFIFLFESLLFGKGAKGNEVGLSICCRPTRPPTPAADLPAGRVANLVSSECEHGRLLYCLLLEGTSGCIFAWQMASCIDRGLAHRAFSDVPSIKMTGADGAARSSARPSDHELVPCRAVSGASDRFGVLFHVEC